MSLTPPFDIHSTTEPKLETSMRMCAEKNDIFMQKLLKHYNIGVRMGE